MDTELQVAVREFRAAWALPGPNGPPKAEGDRLIATWHRAGRPGIECVKESLRSAKLWATVYRYEFEVGLAQRQLRSVQPLSAACFGHEGDPRSAASFTSTSKGVEELAGLTSIMIFGADGYPTGLLDSPAVWDTPYAFYGFYAYPSITGGWAHPFLFCRACAFRFTVLRLLSGLGRLP